MESFLKNLNKQIEQEKQKTLRPLGESAELRRQALENLWDGRMVSHEEREKFATIFNEANVNSEPKLGMELAMKLFKSSGLEVDELTKIWDLSDFDKDNKLDKEEFVLAMYLIQARLSGDELPETLPRSLTPIKPRPIEYISIPSIADLKIAKTESGVLKREFSTVRLGKAAEGRSSYKICVIGDHSGKSSLIMRFLHNEFTTKEEATVEAHYDANYDYEEKECHLELLDTSGSEFYLDSMQEKWFSFVDGFLLVYAVDSRDSFKMLESFRLRVMGVVKDDRIPIVVVGTRADRVDARQVTSTEGKLWAHKYNFGFVECSAKTAERIEEPFQLLLQRILKNSSKGLVVQVQPHKWKKTLYPAPTTCKRCNKLIWGIMFSYGYSCDVCKYNAHRNCRDRVPQACAPQRLTRPNTNSLTDITPSSPPTVKIDGVVITDAVSMVTEQELLPTLQDEKSCSEFVKYMEEKHATLGVEYVRFWAVVEEFKTLKDSTLERKSKAVSIHTTYFVNGNLKFPVDIAEAVRVFVQTDKVDTELFNDAQLFAYSKLEKEYFPPYVRRSLYTTYRGLDQLVGEKSESKPSASSIFATSPPTPQKSHYETVPPSSADVEQWYYGGLSRAEAEQLLFAVEDEVYLIRTSSVEGRYALSIYYYSARSIVHYIIATVDSGAGFALQDCPMDSQTYSSLTELVHSSPAVKELKPLGRFNPNPITST